MTRRRFNPLPELILLAVLIAMPFVLTHAGASLDMLSRIMNWGLIGIGFDLIFGATGLLSFGQAAFYGTGGFITAYLLVNHVISSVWLGLLIGTIVAGILGVVIGWLSVRRIGIYFAMITLAFGEMAYFVENAPLAHYTGGENGLPGVPVPTIGAYHISVGLPMYGLLAGFFFIGYILARRILHSPFGLVLHGIKENTFRTGVVGHSVSNYKLAVFVIGALYAGLAGGLLGVLQSYMPPDAFSLDTSGQLVVQTVIGGVGTLIGPAVGATVWLYLQDNLQLIHGVGALWKLILGLVFVILVLALKRGIAGEIAWAFRRRKVAPAEIEAGDAAAEVPPAAVEIPMVAPLVRIEPSAPALRAIGLSKHFGGLHANEDVSFDVRTGSIHAVIGPNGAGKSTLFKMLADEISPTSGEVRLFGRRITGLGITRTTQLGIAKSNQLNQLFLGLTVAENLRIAALARRRGTFRLDLLRDAASIGIVERQVEAAIETVGLGHRADTLVSVLPYGEKRRLEIGMALATGPNVLLLDEPLAGMSPAERIATRALIREIGRTRTLLIVEHDMDAIFELAERITVLYEGRLLADGPPDDISNDQRVQDAYLGGMAVHEPA